jgi:hypothetical protein
MILALALAIPLVGMGNASAQFIAGNLAVARVGDGSTTLSSAAFEVRILEFTTAGAATGFEVNLTSTAGITNSGTATSNGYLNLSLNKTSLVYAGYEAAVGTASVASAAGIPRAPVFISQTGVVNDTTQLSDSNTYNGNNFRAAVSDDGNRIWTAGTGNAVSGTPTNGVRFVANTGDTSSVRLNSTGPTNSRVTDIFQGNTVGSNPVLFATNQTAVWRLGDSTTPLPAPGTPDTVTPTSIVTGLSEAYGFVFLDVSSTVGDPFAGGLDTLYVAQDSASATLLKFEFDGFAWVARGQLAINNASQSNITGENGAFGLTATIDGNGVRLYGTTLNTRTGENDNHLFTVLDNSGFGNNIAGTFDSLGRAGANFRFAGIDFTPVPEPTTMALAGLGMSGVIARYRRRVKAKKSAATAAAPVQNSTTKKRGGFRLISRKLA